MSASGLAAHPSPAELGQRYRAARSPIERSHLQVVWLLSRGRSEREVAQVTGYGRRWVGEVARRYEEGGPDGLGDRRRGNPGARALLGAGGGGGRVGGGGGGGRGGRGGRARQTGPPTAGCGRGRRWRRGWRPGSAARSGRNAAGTTSRNSATAPSGPGRGTPRRRARRSRRRTKKPERQSWLAVDLPSVAPWGDR